MTNRFSSRWLVFLIWIIAIQCSLSLQASGVSLEGFKLERYAKLWEKSPFSLSSAPDMTPSGGIGDRFSIANISAMKGSGGKKYLVMLTKKGSAGVIILSEDPKHKNSEGIKLVSVENYSGENVDLEKIIVKISKGRELGIVKFDSSVIAMKSGKLRGNIRGGHSGSPGKNHLAPPLSPQWASQSRRSAAMHRPQPPPPKPQRRVIRQKQIPSAPPPIPR